MAELHFVIVCKSGGAEYSGKRDVAHFNETVLRRLEYKGTLPIIKFIMPFVLKTAAHLEFHQMVKLETDTCH